MFYFQVCDIFVKDKMSVSKFIFFVYRSTAVTYNILYKYIYLNIYIHIYKYWKKNIGSTLVTSYSTKMAAEQFGKR